MREVSLARQTWDILKPLEPNPDTINVERHLRTQFQLSPPRLEACMPQNSSFNNIISSSDQQLSDPSLYSPHSATFLSTFFPDAPRSISQTLLSPQASHIRQKLDAHRTETFLAENSTFSSSEGTNSHSDGQRTFESQTALTSIGEIAISPASAVSPVSIVSPTMPTASMLQKTPKTAQSPLTISFDDLPAFKSRNVQLLLTPERTKSGWRSKLTRSKKEPSAATLETHPASQSPTTLEAQSLEEISLTSMISIPKSLARTKTARTIRDVNVSLSQNSTHALFWSQSIIHILDVATCPSTVVQALATDGTCILAAVTKVYLAYIVKSQDHKLTVILFLLSLARALLMHKF